MTFADLRSRFSKHELSDSPGNHELKYQVFAPFLQNLFEDKVVYDEKFLCIVRLANLEITPEGFSALALLCLSMSGDAILDRQPPTEPWTIEASWGDLRLINSSLKTTHGCWSIWPEHDRVKSVEQILVGALQDAWLLTCNEPEIIHGTE